MNPAICSFWSLAVHAMRLQSHTIQWKSTDQERSTAASLSSCDRDDNWKEIQASSTHIWDMAFLDR